MRRLRDSVAAVVVLAGLLGVPTPAQDTGGRAAVPLRTPQLRTPDEAAGTGLAPEVQVRVHIDERGRVSAVDVLGIRPASEFDALFEAETRQTLLLWRYAPALRDGVPVTSELEWTIGFPSRQATADDTGPAPFDPAPWASAGRDRSDDLWRRILALPESLRRRMLEGMVETARGQLDAQHVQRFDSPRFVVFTDATKPGLAEAIAGNFEASFNAVAALFQPLIEPRAGTYKVLVFAYASAEPFHRLSREVQHVEWAAGFYNPAGLIAFNLELATNESVVATLIHEATHAFFDRHVARPGVFPPRWLGEGFAEYVGNSAIRKGKLVPGKTPRSQIYWTGWQPELGISEQIFGVDRVRAALRNGSAPTVERLMSADPQTFYGEERQLFYTMSWLVVHFLRHGDPGWAEGEFPRFVLYVAEGYPAPQALATVYGVTPAAIEDRFRAYVKQF